jgi:hypothetical protein
MKKIKGFIFTAMLFLFLCPVHTMAQTDTINFSNNKLKTKQLKPGLKQYLVYLQQPGQKKKLNLSIWTREVKFTTNNNEKQFTITQKWYTTDTAGYRSIYSINRAKDFAPVYHSEMIGNQLKAFNWYPDHIKGADTVSGNNQKSFSLQLAQPTFNWNLDIETMEMLPLAAGKKFVLPLYDAGSGKPDYVVYQVSGDEVLQTLDKRKVDCWTLVYSGVHGQIKYTQTFWISKQEHEFLLEIDEVNGMYRYKVKLPGYAPDLVQRFK